MVKCQSFLKHREVPLVGTLKKNHMCSELPTTATTCQGEKKEKAQLSPSGAVCLSSALGKGGSSPLFPSSVVYR